MSARYTLQNTAAVNGRKIFFDANVLLYIFWPTGSYALEADYANAFARLRRQQNELMLDFIVISEIVNRAMKIEYERHIALNNLVRQGYTYKTYRNSRDGQATLADIYLIIKADILPYFAINGKSFSKADIENLLVANTLDFGDKGIHFICKENNCVLITNDNDFKHTDIDILSANTRLCP